MTKITIKCTYQTSENPRGAQELLPTSFLAKLTINDDGTVASWEVDDRTACFYTDLAKYDESVIQFEGSEIKGQTGSLLINRGQGTFVQKSDVNGEWLVLKGTSEETFAKNCVALQAVRNTGTTPRRGRAGVS